MLIKKRGEYVSNDLYASKVKFYIKVLEMESASSKLTWSVLKRGTALYSKYQYILKILPTEEQKKFRL